MGLMSSCKNPVFLQLVRYTLVSAVALVVDVSALVALTEVLHLHYLFSAALAFTLGVATNYTLSVLWVFDARAMSSRWAEFLSFALLGVIGLGLNEVVLLALTGWLGIHYAASKLAATGLTFGWNFVSRKLLLFSRPAAPAGELQGDPKPEFAAGAVQVATVE
jgi:putative flippase GtrA